MMTTIFGFRAGACAWAVAAISISAAGSNRIENVMAAVSALDIRDGLDWTVIPRTPPRDQLRDKHAASAAVHGCIRSIAHNLPKLMLFTVSALSIIGKWIKDRSRRDSADCSRPPGSRQFLQNFMLSVTTDLHPGVPGLWRR